MRNKDTILLEDVYETVPKKTQTFTLRHEFGEDVSETPIFIKANKAEIVGDNRILADGVLFEIHPDGLFKVIASKAGDARPQ